MTNEDLAVFANYPEIQILSLVATSVTDDGLKHLENLRNLQCLALRQTLVTERGVNDLRRLLPNASITMEGPPKGTISPFTGQQFE